jgi:hypothetical protein
MEWNGMNDVVVVVVHPAHTTRCDARVEDLVVVEFESRSSSKSLLISQQQQQQPFASKRSISFPQLFIFRSV